MITSSVIPSANFLLRVAAHVLERQDGDRRLSSSAGGAAGFSAVSAMASVAGFAGAGRPTSSRKARTGSAMS